MSRLSHVCDCVYLVLDSRYIAVIYDTMVHAEHGSFNDNT